MSGGAVLVAGASGAVGFEIVRALRATNVDVIATYRTPRPETVERLRALGARAGQWDMADTDRGRALLREASRAIFTPILTVSEKAATLAPEKPLLFFSSNNVGVDDQSSVYRLLKAAEEAVTGAAPGAMILRPTMIYGYPGDGNLSALMAAMRRFPVTPLVGSGRAQQQPVFYRDLAQIAAGLITEDAPPVGIHAVAGPDALMQSDLYAAVRSAIDAKGVTVRVPTQLVGAIAKLGLGLGVRFPLSPAQIARADRDKTPVGDRVLYGDTALADGLAELAAALDGAAPGA